MIKLNIKVELVQLNQIKNLKNHNEKIGLFQFRPNEFLIESSKLENRILSIQSKWSISYNILKLSWYTIAAVRIGTSVNRATTYTILLFD